MFANIAYDMPLFRPPSEGDNLIFQVTLGCSYNRCSFCSMYRDKEYRARPIAEVTAEMDRAARTWPTAHRLFFADGDAFSLPTAHLAELLDAAAARFPDLARVSAYAIPASLLKKSPEELALLRSKKLSLLYVGIESGAPAILKKIAKGASQNGLATAFAKARAAGIKTSATMILGLGGKAHWREHIDGTVELVNRSPPNFLSTLQLGLEENVAEDFFARQGEDFEFQDDGDMLLELERLIAGLAPPHPVIFRSNHASNALPLAGTLPKDRDKLLARLAEAKTEGRGLRPHFLRGF